MKFKLCARQNLTVYFSNARTFFNYHFFVLADFLQLYPLPGLFTLMSIVDGRFYLLSHPRSCIGLVRRGPTLSHGLITSFKLIIAALSSKFVYASTLPFVRISVHD